MPAAAAMWGGGGKGGGGPCMGRGPLGTIQCMPAAAAAAAAFCGKARRGETVWSCLESSWCWMFLYILYFTWCAMGGVHAVRAWQVCVCVCVCVCYF
jgi:hypothetical protein